MQKTRASLTLKTTAAGSEADAETGSQWHWLTDLSVTQPPQADSLLGDNKGQTQVA